MDDTSGQEKGVHLAQETAGGHPDTVLVGQSPDLPDYKTGGQACKRRTKLTWPRLKKASIVHGASVVQYVGETSPIGHSKWGNLLSTKNCPLIYGCSDLVNKVISDGPCLQVHLQAQDVSARYNPSPLPWESGITCLNK